MDLPTFRGLDLAQMSAGIIAPTSPGCARANTSEVNARRKKPALREPVMPALSPDLLKNGRVLARRKLPQRRADLSAGQSTAGKPGRAQAHQAPLARTLGVVSPKPGLTGRRQGPSNLPAAARVADVTRHNGLADKTGSTSSGLARPKPIIFCSRLGRNILYPDLSGPPSARNSGIPLRDIIGIFHLQLRGYQFAIEHAEVTSHADADADSKSRRFLQASGCRNSSRAACGQGTAGRPRRA